MVLKEGATYPQPFQEPTQPSDKNGLYLVKGENNKDPEFRTRKEIQSKIDELRGHIEIRNNEIAKLQDNSSLEDLFKRGLIHADYIKGTKAKNEMDVQKLQDDVASMLLEIEKLESTKTTVPDIHAVPERQEASIETIDEAEPIQKEPQLIEDDNTVVDSSIEQSRIASPDASEHLDYVNLESTSHREVELPPESKELIIGYEDSLYQLDRMQKQFGQELGFLQMHRSSLAYIDNPQQKKTMQERIASLLQSSQQTEHYLDILQDRKTAFEAQLLELGIDPKQAEEKALARKALKEQTDALENKLITQQNHLNTVRAELQLEPDSRKRFDLSLRSDEALRNEEVLFEKLIDKTKESLKASEFKKNVSTKHIYEQERDVIFDKLTREGITLKPDNTLTLWSKFRISTNPSLKNYWDAYNTADKNIAELEGKTYIPKSDITIPRNQDLGDGSYYWGDKDFTTAVNQSLNEQIKHPETAPQTLEQERDSLFEQLQDFGIKLKPDNTLSFWSKRKVKKNPIIREIWDRYNEVDAQIADQGFDGFEESSDVRPYNENLVDGKLFLGDTQHTEAFHEFDQQIQKTTPQRTTIPTQVAPAVPSQYQTRKTIVSESVPNIQRETQANAQLQNHALNDETFVTSKTLTPQELQHVIETEPTLVAEEISLDQKNIPTKRTHTFTPQDTRNKALEQMSKIERFKQNIKEKKAIKKVEQELEKLKEGVQPSETYRVVSIPLQLYVLFKRKAFIEQAAVRYTHLEEQLTQKGVQEKDIEEDIKMHRIDLMDTLYSDTIDPDNPTKTIRTYTADKEIEGINKQITESFAFFQKPENARKAYETAKSTAENAQRMAYIIESEMKDLFENIGAVLNYEPISQIRETYHGLQNAVEESNTVMNNLEPYLL